MDEYFEILDAEERKRRDLVIMMFHDDLADSFDYGELGNKVPSYETEADEFIRRKKERN